MRLPKSSLPLIAIALGALLLAGCSRRPDFNLDHAHQEIASAFSRRTGEVAVYGDGRDGEAAWIVDFQLDGFSSMMQARFLGVDDRWQLSGMRETPELGQEPPWEEVGVLINRLRGDAATKAVTTRETMEELTAFIERYTVEHENKFPQVVNAQLQDLIVGAGYVKSDEWAHSNDGWGHAFLYHAAPDGSAYILISRGADGETDIAVDEYFRNTDEGVEVYAGPVADLNRDIIYATGSFVQYFRAD